MMSFEEEYCLFVADCLLIKRCDLRNQDAGRNASYQDLCTELRYGLHPSLLCSLPFSFIYLGVIAIVARHDGQNKGDRRNLRIFCKIGLSNDRIRDV